MFDVKHRFGDQTRLLLICLAPSKAEAEQCREWQHRMPPIRVETLVTGDCQDYEIPSTNVPIAVLGVGAACREAVKYARSLATSGHDVADIVFVNPLPQELEPVGTPFECRVECFTTATISESDLQPLTTGPCSIHPLSAHAVPQPPPASKPMANGVASGGALRPSANGVANGVAHGAPNGAANGAAHGLLFEGNDRDDPLGEQVLRALCHHHLELPLQHLVLHQACLTPDATAVVYEDERLSYAEFCSVAWDLAGRIGQSVPPTAHISVCVPKCAWLPVTWMAACLCRCPFFSLDLRVPVPTIEYQVDLWEPLLIVCWDPQDIAHLRPQLPRLDLQALLPQLQRTTPPRTIQRAAPSGLLEDVIAIEWTSGTTGKPKGVEVAQRGLVHWVFWRWWQYPLSESDPYVSAMNLFYFWYWALPLCQGGAVVLVPDVMNYSVQKVALYLQRHNVTRLESVTPSLLRVWLEVATDADLAALARLKITNVSSEPTSLELCKLFFHKLPRCRLVNILACTETSSDVAFCEMSPDVIADAQQAGLTYAPIGKPIWNVDVKLAPLDPELGYDAESGELWVAGPNIHHGGYYKRPDLSAKFDAWPSGETVYKSGDVATRINSDGRRLLAIIGRADHCVKVRGFRIELNAVEETLKQCDKVMDAALVVRGDELWAVVVYVPPASGAAVDEHQLTAYLLAHAKRLLPAHHLPDKVIPQATLPYTINGKLDRKTILQTLDTPQPDTTATSAEVPPPASPAPAGTPEAAQQRVVQAWQAVLHGTDVPRDVSFFEAGGQSLTAIKLAAHLDIDIMDIFAHPTVEALAEFIHRREHPEITAGVAAGGSRFGLQDGDWEVAVVGMAGRWPGAQDYDVFWANIVSGAESVTTFTHREMQEAGVPPELLKHPHWVPKGAVLDPAVVEAFDLQFWGLPKQEAVTMDCNHRILLEIAYEALEDAGYNPFACPGAVGVYACGPSLPHYLLDVWPEDVRTLRLTDPARYMELEVGSDKDYISTRVSYLLNLTGPSKTIQTACSSSLVCVAEAVQQLRMGDCTMALAGGVSVFPPQCTGYLFQEGMIWAPDARCRPFDAAAKGTHNSNAGAVVVLKGCRAAEADGDCVRAVVQGVAVNNDGRTKVGYLAPSVRGQSAVYGKALADAGVGADAIGYVECHGTGTVLGDPLELTALGQAYQRHTAETQYCAIGSVKANIGHANTAAGICGFVKAVLCAARATLPPLAHFVHPNPKLDLARSPFWVPTACQPWTHSTRVAAATSLGMGGTNAHVLLRSVEPHTPEPPGTPSVAGGWHLLALSAHTPAALQNASTRLAARLAGETAPDALARAERTLLLRRPHIAKCRRAVVCRTLAGGAAALVAAAQAPPPPPPAPSGRPVVLLFPGQGSQYPGMGAGLYAHWPRYRAAMDACSRLAGRDCQALDPNTTLGAQLAIFATSYALATALTEGYGIAPVALVGHSVGQYVAACVGGALSLGDAVAVLLARGAAMELMAGDAATAMVAVQAAADALQPLPDGLALACVNAPARCVVAGPAPALQAWQRAQEARGVACRPLPTAAAFHSAAVTPEVMARFKAGVAGYAFAAPRVPVACNVTGGYLSATQPTDAGYWARHMRSTVRFEDNVRAVLRDHPTAALVEVGPGQSLTALARLCVAAQPRPASPPQAPVVVPTTRHPKTSAEDAEVLLTAVGRLWEAGVSLDWAGGLGPSRALPLPTYPFDRVRCWPDPKGRAPREPKAVHAGPGRAASPAAAKPPVAVVPPAVNYDTPQSTADLLYCVQWHPQAMVPAPPTPALQAPRVPVCLDGGDRSVLARLGLRHVPVAPGPELLAAAQMHRRLLWVCAAAAGDVEDEHEADRQLDATGRFLTAVQELLTQRIRCQVVLVVRERAVRHAGLLGLARSLALEHPELGLRRIVWDGVAGLAAEVAADHAEPEVWVRGDGRAVPRFVRYALPACAPGAARPLRAEACYLVTGGLRGIGLLVAEWLARRKGARHLVLVGRAPPAAPVAAHLAALAAATGCAITPAQCDVADAAAVAALLAGLARPLRGVVHCAGTVDDGAALKCTPDRLARVVRPKAAAWHLHRLTAAQPLDFMVLFSSSAGVWGTAGQASYAAGNTCLDCLAAHRARQGLPTVAVQWGGWEAVGMSVDLGLTATNGEEYLTPAQGLAVLDQLLQRVVASPDPVAGADAGAAAAAATTAPAVPPQLTVINVADWAKFRADAQLFGSAHPPLLASLDPAELAAPGAPRPVHPLLGAPEGSPGRGWAQAYVLPPYVREHQYRGSPLVPATCYLEMACAAALQLRPRAAAGQPVVLRDVEFVAPLALADLAHRVLATVVEPPSKPGVTEELRLRIMSRLQTAAAGEAGAHTVHATCRIGGPTGGPQAPKAPRDATDTEAWEPDALYAAFAAAGFGYGPSFRLVTRATAKAQSADCTVALPVALAAEGAAQYCALHPAAWDACTHAASLVPGGAGLGGVPARIGIVVVHNAGIGCAWTTCAVSAQLAAAGGVHLNIVAETATTPSGEAAGVARPHTLDIEMRDFFMHTSREPVVDPVHCYGVSWAPLPPKAPAPAPAPATPQHWVVAAAGAQHSAPEAALRLQSALQAHGDRTVTLTDLHGCAAAGAGPRPCSGIVVFAPSDAESDPQPVADALLEVMDRARPSACGRVWLVAPFGGAVWGLGRHVQRALPGLLLTLVCLAGTELPAELLWDAATPAEVRVDASGGVLVPRARPLAAASGRPADEVEERVVDGDAAYVVSLDPKSGIDGAGLRLCSRDPPKENQVEIRTQYWALNFRDVLVALGVIPMDVAGQSLGIGGECVGTVTAVGAGVNHVAVGDTVVALPPDGLGRYVVTDAAFVFRKPPNLDSRDAVGITLAYATAWLALKHLGRVAAGDRVLVHSAAGGVGLAAVQIAHHFGAEVYATCSTAEKRQCLTVCLHVLPLATWQGVGGGCGGLLQVVVGCGQLWHRMEG